jgi:prepilin-type N-terminal cleavage/methylation domain-containing protein
MQNKIKNKIKKYFKNFLKLQAPSSKLQASFGFTLVEIMVAVSIFTIVMVISIGAVLAMVSANKRSQAYSTVITNLNFALEGMIRDIRTGYDYDCDPATPGLQGVDNVGAGGGSCDGTQIKFYSIQSGDYVEYDIISLSTGEKYIQKTVFVDSDNDGNVDGEETYDITGGSVIIDTNVTRFYVYGVETATAGSEYSQPKVLVVIRGTFNGFGMPSQFSLQTTVSQRKLDI